MIENKLELNHTYLVKLGGVIVSMTVLLITNKAYHMRRNNGLKSTDSWEEIRTFNNTYTIVEDITEHMVDYNKTFYEKICDEMAKTPSSRVCRITCTTCGGKGRIPDSSSTAGDKLCPHCFGTKTIQCMSFESL